MEYLNRANNTLSGINRIHGEASNMMNTLRHPADYSMQNQFYYPFNQNTKENFFDTVQSCDWWIILVLLFVLFIMLYSMNSKK